ncbi:hypothetical protein GQ55_5G345400 [Panicum hallii var. hallii]|uniref:Uncharacterized protein n=1 Tax=Panicum hallii var. hallii TaxID=1504633 RepID=A0A2T7DM69_9POAL|nr:hypothetical protein GQ55_5G345400 [Panicum hallii var. hallii]
MNPVRHPSLLMVVSDGSESGGSTGGRSSQPDRGSSGRIRGAPRWRRRVHGQGGQTGGPLRWTTSRLRVDFNGQLYVADTEDQGCRIGGAGDAGEGWACCRGAGGGCRRWVCSGCGRANVGATCGQ